MNGNHHNPRQHLNYNPALDNTVYRMVNMFAPTDDQLHRMSRRASGDRGSGDVLAGASNARKRPLSNGEGPPDNDDDVSVMGNTPQTMGATPLALVAERRRFGAMMMAPTAVPPRRSDTDREHTSVAGVVTPKNNGDNKNKSFGSSRNVSGASERTSMASNISSQQCTPLKRFKIDKPAATPSSIGANSTDVIAVGSPREFRSMRADLSEARHTIRTLEQRIQQLHDTNKTLRITFDNETEHMRAQSERDIRHEAELQSQLADVRRREQAVRADLSEARNRFAQLTAASEIEEQRMRQQLAYDANEQAAHKLEDSTELSMCRQQLEACRSQCEVLTQDIELQKAAFENIQKELTNKNSIERDLEMRQQELLKARLEIRKLQYERESFADYQEQSKIHNNKLATYTDLEKENKRLRDDVVRLRDEVRNKLILEEEVYDLKNAVTSLKERDEKFKTLQVTHAQLELDLEDWRNVGRSVLDASVPARSYPRKMREYVDRLQQQEIIMAAEQMDIKSRLVTANEDLHNCKSKIAKLCELKKQRQCDIEASNKIIRRLEKKVTLVCGERDSYRSQLDSYERDLTLSFSPANVVASGSGTSTQQICARSRERIDALEQSAQGYRDIIAKLEADLQQAERTPREEVAPARAEQLARLQDDYDKLKEENIHLRERRDRLEIQLESLSAGLDTTGKVYHVIDNPLSDCVVSEKQCKERLQEEVERLKAKVRRLEEGQETSTLGDSVVLCSKDLISLREQVAQHKLRESKLKETFHKRITDFREAAQMMFGYQVDLLKENHYKVLSNFAQQEDDYLVFAVNPTNGLELLETEFSNQISHLIESDLIPHRSIPHFLSTLTLELFRLTTQSMIEL